MFKYRWFDVSFDLPLDELVGLLRKFPFVRSDDDADGFRVESIKADTLRAQYIESQVLVDIVNLPTGERIEQPFAKISVTDFMISAGQRLGLQLINPARRNLAFFNALGEACSHEFYVESVNVDIMAWLGVLEERVGALSVTYVDCSGVSLSNSIQARVAIAGNDDVRRKAADFLGAHRCVVERARCISKTEPNLGVIELSRGGWAKLNQSPEHRIVGDIKESLVTASFARS